MNLLLASLFSFGAGQFEKKDSFFFKWPRGKWSLVCINVFHLIPQFHFIASLGTPWILSKNAW